MAISLGLSKPHRYALLKLRRCGGNDTRIEWRRAKRERENDAHMEKARHSNINNKTLDAGLILELMFDEYLDSLQLSQCAVPSLFVSPNSSKPGSSS